MTMMSMAFVFAEKEEKIDDKIQDRVDVYMHSFFAEKIIYNGVVGYFVPISGWKNVELYIRDYVYYQDLVLAKDERIKQLEKYEVTIFKYRTALGVTISFDVGTTLVAIGLGMLCYNLALVNK